MARDPYLTTESLRAMKGMFDHIGHDEEAFVSRKGMAKKPFPLDYNQAPFRHVEQGIADDLGGMAPEIMCGLLTFAYSQIGKDPGITKAYKDLLMLAKLSCPPQTLQVAQDKLADRQLKAQTLQAEYDKRNRDFNQRVAQSRAQFHEYSGELRTRWERVLKSLRAVVAADPKLESMSRGDQDIFHYLNKHGYVDIQNGEVVNFSYELTVPDGTTMANIVEAMFAIAKQMEDSGLQRTRQQIVDSRKPKTQIVSEY